MRLLKDEEEYLLRMIAHELRTPFTAISWIFQELSKPDLTEKQRKELVRLGQLATAKLDNITNAFSEVLGSKYSFQFQTVEALGLIGRVIEETEPLAKHEGISLNFERPRSHIPISADPVRLMMALSALIHNGIKYNRKRGSVIVMVRQLLSRHKLEITVSDTGIGISPREKEHLFKKYFRTKDAKRLNPTGSGLGLFLAKRIISAHRGTIHVESVPGKGTAFRIELPLK